MTHQPPPSSPALTARVTNNEIWYKRRRQDSRYPWVPSDEVGFILEEPVSTQVNATGRGDDDPSLIEPVEDDAIADD
jgi:hypothetical protein